MKKLEEIQNLLKARVLVEGDAESEASFDTVCGCDMMSELLIMLNDRVEHAPGVLLLTNLANPQVVRTSEMVDIRLVVFLRNKQPMPDTIQLARECGVTLMSTPYTMFQSCGILYEQKMRDVKREKGIF